VWFEHLGNVKYRVSLWWDRRHCLPGGDVPSVVVLLSLLLLTPSQTYSKPEGEENHEDGVAIALAHLGKQGDVVLRARSQVLNILQNENTCSAWFRETDPDAAEVFRSVHFGMEQNGPAVAYGQWVPDQGKLLKHPWGARSTQNAGRGALIEINGNGPFFRSSSPILQRDPWGTITRPAGNLALVISTYNGNSPEAQMTILLHELGHIIGRIPEDNDSWDGRSSRNTSEVVRHCKAEIKAEAHNTLRASN
jgi:hypothetical protein